MSELLGAAEIRELAASIDLKPTKVWGQNFVIDANTVRSIVKHAGITDKDDVVEVGPGLGSLTLALLEASKSVTVIEIDPKLAKLLPLTVARKAGDDAKKLNIVQQDALTVKSLPVNPTALVANLPYNVSVPVIIHLLTQFPSIKRVLVMVQAEVADRLAAGPGSKIYGVPSVKARWFGNVKKVATIGKNVFWPAPNIDSALVLIERHQTPLADIAQADLFAAIDAAFGQRRKMLRSALNNWASGRAEEILNKAGIDPTLRGEQLDVNDYVKIANAKKEIGGV
ncbi:MAG: rRNA ((1518)-N(6)/adenine(1519)-N(6))-dimethyltransferase RsmA [Actinomycetota bacterium]|jgi:16S rRNA (adenine1518-N6/adenine1519-N6)-dimethyltransferase